MTVQLPFDFSLCHSGYLTKARTINPTIHILTDTPPIFPMHASDDNEGYGGSNAKTSAFMYAALSAPASRRSRTSTTGDTTSAARMKTPRAGPSSNPTAAQPKL